MRVLHIINDYNHTQVHKNLVSHLDCLNVEQYVFIPCKNTSDVGRNEFTFKNKQSKFEYSSPLKKRHRFFFKSKIRALYVDVLNRIDITKIDLIQASTLYSDGFLAYQLFKEFGLPYIVCVRNTDLFFFYKYRKDLAKEVMRVLDNASMIVFVSEANRKFFEFINWPMKSAYRSKSITINNAIDDFWLSNRLYHDNARRKINFLYIGRFDRNKNVLQLISAFERMNQDKKEKIRLNLVGGNGQEHDRVLERVKTFEWLTYHGRIDDKIKLLKVYRDNDVFIMISKKETFGLVYLEALSQGLPVVFTRDQGIDGFSNYKIGERVDLKRDFIINGVERTLTEDYSDINQLEVSEWSWSSTSLKYYRLYEKIC